MLRPLLLILAFTLQYLPARPNQDLRRSGDFSRAQQYLLMQPIQDSLKSGDFSKLEAICQKRISVNLEAPFYIQGYFAREQFSLDFAARFSRFSAENIEWGSMQVEEKLAVQSLNVILLDKGSRKRIVYKLIFFMIGEFPAMGKEREWRLYYLRGLRL